jgi:hypothetical protein
VATKSKPKPIAIYTIRSAAGGGPREERRRKGQELFDKIRTLEKIVGPEYVALIEGIEDISENDQLRAEFSSAFGALVRLCTR